MVEIFNIERPFSFNFNCFRSWLVILANLSKHHKKFYESITKILVPDSVIQIKKSNKILIINFIKEALDKPNDFVELAMCYQCLGVIATAYIGKDEDFDVMYQQYLEKFEKIKKRPRLVNSILLIFTDKHDGKPAQNVIIIPNSVNEDHFLTQEAIQQVKSQTSEFISSIYIVLESKIAEYKGYRLTSTFFKCSIEANFESEMDTKSIQKIMGARTSKIMGDVCMLMGNYFRAFSLYNIAIDVLLVYCDNLWLGASYEGMASACHFITCPSPGKSSILQIEAVSRRGSSDDIESTSQISDAVKMGSFKYVLDALDHYRQYFSGKSLFAEYHLFGVLLNNILEYSVLPFEFSQIVTHISDRMKTIQFLPDRLYIVELVAGVYEKFRQFRKHLVTLVYFSRKAVDYTYEPAYEKAESFSLKVLRLINFDFQQSTSLSEGWYEIAIESLTCLMAIYKNQNRLTEAIRIAIYLLSHTHPNVKSIKNDPIMDELNSTHDLEPIKPYEHLPQTYTMNCETKLIDNFVNISTFESDQQVGPFIFFANTAAPSNSCTLIPIGEPIVVNIGLKNPLPLIVSFTITILTDPPNIAASDTSESVIMTANSDTFLSICPKYQCPCKFSIIGYESRFYNMRSVYYAAEPWNFESISVTPLISLKACNFCNASSVVCHSQKTFTDITLSSYAGCIISGHVEIIPFSEESDLKIFVKFIKYDMLKVKSTLKILDTKNRNTINLTIGANNGSQPMNSGNYQMEVTFCAFSPNNSWSLVHQLNIIVKITKHLIADNLVFSPSSVDPLKCICRYMLYNISTTPTVIVLHTGVSSSEICIEPHKSENISYPFTRRRVSEIIELMRTSSVSSVFKSIVTSEASIHWKKHSNDSELNGIFISNFEVSKEDYINLISIPYLTLEIGLEPNPLTSPQAFKSSLDLPISIHFSLKNTLQRDITSVIISLISTSITRSQSSMLWFGSLTKIFSLVEKGQSYSGVFDIIVIKPGKHIVDIVVQSENSKEIQDSVSEFVQSTNCLGEDQPVETLFSVKSPKGATYLSCLAIKSITIDVD